MIPQTVSVNINVEPLVRFLGIRAHNDEGLAITRKKVIPCTLHTSGFRVVFLR